MKTIFILMATIAMFFTNNVLAQQSISPNLKISLKVESSLMNNGKYLDAEAYSSNGNI